MRQAWLCAQYYWRLLVQSLSEFRGRNEALTFWAPFASASVLWLVRWIEKQYPEKLPAWARALTTGLLAEPLAYVAIVLVGLRVLWVNYTNIRPVPLGIAVR